MSILKEVFSLSKEEQEALLNSLEKKAKEKSPTFLPQEVVDTFELPDEIDLEKEFNTLKDAIYAEVKAITITAPKGDKGDKGPKGDKGDTGPQGPKGKDGVDGKDGKDGEDGISVADAHIDFDGSLVITLSNGKEINAGDVVPADKKDVVIQSLKNGALTLLELGIIEYLASPPPIGSVTPNTGTFTTVSSVGTGENLFTYSTNFSASWGLGSSLSNFFNVSTSAITAPDGTLTATQFVASPTTSQGLFLRANQPKNPTTYTVSLYIYVPTQAGISNWNLTVDVGDVESASTTNYTIFNEWVRAVVTIPVRSNRTFFDFNIRVNNGGAPTSGFVLHAWGAQLEIGSTLGTYVPTTASVIYGTPTLNLGYTGSVSLNSSGEIDITSVGNAAVNLKTGSNSPFSVIAREDTSLGTPVTGSIVFEGPRTGLGRSAIKSSNALFLSTSSTNSLFFQTNANTNVGVDGATQFLVSNTTSAVNYVQVTGSITSGAPVISVQGSDANAELVFRTKGIFNHVFQNGSNAINFVVDQTAGSAVVNRLQVAGALTNREPVLSAQGSDTNISLALQSKGTGSIDLASGSTGVNVSNGTTVTAITGTAIGSNYTSIPSVAISAPNIAGGVQATADARMGLWGSPIVSGGTGYTVNDVLTVTGGTFLGGTAQQLRVTAVSGGVITAVTAVNFPTYTVLPTNPVSVTGGTGTGATFNLTWSVYSFNITNAGSGYTSQPTVTFSGGGGSGASAYATVGSGTVLRTLGATMDFHTPSGRQFQVSEQYSAGTVSANYLQVSGRGANAFPTLSSQGSDTNISVGYVSKGTGNHTFITGSGAFNQLLVTHTASAVNYVQVTGAATTGTPVVQAQGSDTNVSLALRAKGNGGIFFQPNNLNQFSVGQVSSAVNYVQAVGSVAGASPSFSALGSDTNININLVPKGTGTVQQNGTALALSTHKYHEFTVGQYYYDDYNQNRYLRLFTENAAADTIRYGAVNTPEYWDFGTSAWVSWAAGLTGIQNLLDGNPQTGIDVNHTNRRFRFVVTNSDGWPTNTLIMLQSTWSAVTYTTATVTIESGTAIAGPFTTRQTIVFSSANSGNNWGMHAFYANTLHTGQGFYRITIDLTDWVDSGTYVTYPLRNLNIFSNYSAVAGRQNPFSTAYDKYTNFVGGIRTPADQNGSLDLGRYNGQDSVIDTGSNATGLTMRTKYLTQFRVANTDNAVNYVQVTGAATGNKPTISALGSDTNINLDINSKGSGFITFNSGSSPIMRMIGSASTANYATVTGGATGVAPAFSVAGTDTNINLALTPKGTGRVQFGTHTAIADTAITGYIEIVDAGGTVRRLAVIS